MHKSDLEIAREATLAPIQDIAASAGLKPDDLELYGPYMSKISAAALQRLDSRPDGKLVLVTAISPTPAGEGKTTVTIGLADALNASGRKAIVAMREPSLGPVMGLKGGAAGGGYAQVLPMENINLHFTGDLHAITAANNAISALLDNHIFQGNELNIDPRRVIWKRALDMNDRALRKVIVGLGGPVQGIPREDGFDITVASEVMAVLCLSTGIVDLKARLARMVVGYTFDKRPVTVGDLRIEGALALLLREAIRPNLVQTIYRTPAFVHGGPFANIAHGCNSLIATRTALKLGDWVVTEGGFGADLGAEKFLNIKAPRLGKVPDAVVIVATIRSLKMHGGLHREDLGREDVEALRRGFPNLQRHVESIRGFGLPAVVAINRFNSDTGAEVGALAQLCAEQGITVVHTEIWARGPAGGGDLAEAVVRAAQNPPAAFTPTYVADAPLEDKINAIVTKIYGGSGVHFSTKAREQMGTFAANGWDRLPVCMAKTQYSLSDDPSLLGRPAGFTVTVRELAPRLGAGFIVAFTGDMLTMPGLPKKPAALNMDVDRDGTASGLF